MAGDPKIAREAILKEVENQLRDNKPKITKQTLWRLTKEGYTAQNAKILIAQCVAVEIFQILKYKEDYNIDRYTQNLRRLPNPPLDKEEE